MKRVGVAVLLILFSLSPSRPAGAAELLVKSALVRLIERVDLSARIDGVLQSVEVEEGDRVKAGELLAQIDDAQARVIHERALLEAKIARMEAENDVEVRDASRVLEVARRELQRAERTVERVPGSISESKLDTLRLAADQAALALERAGRELDVRQATLGVKENIAAEAEVTLQRHRIVTPIAGIVAAVEKRAGETVKVGEQTFRVVNDGRLRIEGFLATRDFQPGLVGAKARLEFTLASGSRRTVEGRVVFISPENDPHNGEVRVWIEFDNSTGQWRPGMRPQAVIEAPATPRSASPRSATPRSAGRPAVPRPTRLGRP